MGRKAFEKVSQREYARRLGISNEAVSRAVREGRIKKGWNEKEGKIIVEYADREFGLLHKNTNVSQLLSDSTEQTNDVPTTTTEKMPVDDGGLVLNSKVSYGEARRIKEIISGQLLALELKQKKGELVNRDEVYKKLYEFGQELRTALLVVPDRTIDLILAADSRHESHKLLVDALYEVLETITNRKIDFSTRK
jgi:hypothetical protein